MMVPAIFWGLQYQSEEAPRGLYTAIVAGVIPSVATLISVCTRTKQHLNLRVCVTNVNLEL
jgi:hypothetical protein